MSAFTEPSFAIEPLTPRGVAAFARASLDRLLVVQGVFAAIATAVMVWLVSEGMFPTVEAAIRNLPEQGSVRAGKLDWRGDSPELLAEGSILAFTVDLEHSGALRSPADFQFEFGKDSVRAFSLFGEAEWSYAKTPFSVSRHDVRPAWGAWSPNFLALLAIGTFCGLMFSWALLATLYCLPVWIICFFCHRHLTLRASWKLAGAALMPGSLLMTASLAFYQLGLFDLVQFCFASGMHIVIGWIYLFVSPMFLNRATREPAKKENPFKAA